MRRALLVLACIAAAGRPGAADANEKAPHPEPRVIIDVASTKRTKASEAVQAAARRGFWGQTVGCYRASAKDAPKLEVDATLRVEVRGGAVRAAKLQKRRHGRIPRELAKKHEEVGACLAKKLVGLEMPRDVRATQTLRIRVWPGDAPAKPEGS